MTMKRIGAFYRDPLRVRDIAMAGLEILLQEPRTDPQRLAAIGYCFGGTMALELARGGADLAVAVGFHSGLQTQRPAVAGEVKAKVLVCIGADDPIVPPEQRLAFEQEMRAAEVDWRMNLYGGAEHSFTNPNAGQSGMPGLAYDQATDERSWRAMLDFFDERLGPV